MFDLQVDDSGLHPFDPTSPETPNGVEWSGYSDPFVEPVPQYFPTEPLEPTFIGEVVGDAKLTPQSESQPLAADPLTGEIPTYTPPVPVWDDTIAAAQHLGVLEGTRTVYDSVGMFDLDDYYRIELNTSATLNLFLDGMTADADLQLIQDRNGDGFADYTEVIDYSLHWDTVPENISVDLPAGTYYVNVTQFSGFTPYTLTLNAAPLPVPVESVSGFDSVDGYGLVNASAAVARVIGSPVPFADVPDGYQANWGVNTINAPEVWSQGFTGEGVVVAVLDTGVDYTHPDLQGRIWQNLDEIPNNGFDDDGNGYPDDAIGWDFIHFDADPMDFDGHGTHVAGIVAAQANDFGITGVAPNAQVMPVQVLSADGWGGIDSLIAGIHYAVNNGADVINMSLGFDSYGSFYYDYTPLQQAIQFAADNGVVVVSAAGNEYGFSPVYPAGYATDWGIAVGASDVYNQFADFSNYAGFTPLDYVVAPGVDIYSTTPNNTYEPFSGTSMAAPQVAGVAALMLQANPNLTVPEVERILMETAAHQVVIA